MTKAKLLPAPDGSITQTTYKNGKPTKWTIPKDGLDLLTELDDTFSAAIGKCKLTRAGTAPPTAAAPAGSPLCAACVANNENGVADSQVSGCSPDCT